MNVLGIENQRVEILNKLESIPSLRRKLLVYYRFFNRLLDTRNENIISSYLAEFIDGYIQCLESFEPFYISPEISFAILNQAETIADFDDYTPFKKLIFNNINRIREQLSDLIKILNGGESLPSGKCTNKYLLLEEDENGNDIMTGVFNSYSVSISPSMKTEFYVEPNNINVRSFIENQIQNSWKAAVSEMQRILGKDEKQYKVKIKFERISGVLNKDTPGLALTLGFMNEIAKQDINKSKLNFKDNVIVTGGINSSGQINSAENNSIERKVECVFYSDTNIFVVPSVDKNLAEQRLFELKKEFPRRKLEIVSVESIADFMNRRNLVEYTRTNAARRIFKNIRSKIVQS